MESEGSFNIELILQKAAQIVQFCLNLQLILIMSL